MLEPVQQKGIPVYKNTPIQHIQERGDCFILRGEKYTFKSRGLILSTGMGLPTPKRLEVPGEKELENNGIYYTLMNPSEWEEKSVLVVGGGNSGVNNALLLHQHKCKITIIHTLSGFQAEEASTNELLSRDIPIFLEHRVVRFEKSGNGKIVTEIQQKKDNFSTRLFSTGW